MRIRCRLLTTVGPSPVSCGPVSSQRDRRTVRRFVWRTDGITQSQTEEFPCRQDDCSFFSLGGAESLWGGARAAMAIVFETIYPKHCSPTSEKLWAFLERLTFLVEEGPQTTATTPPPTAHRSNTFHHEPSGGRASPSQTGVKETFACDEYFQLFLCCLPLHAPLHCFAASCWKSRGGAGTGSNYRLKRFITTSTLYSLFSGCRCGTSEITKATRQITAAPLGTVVAAVADNLYRNHID